MPYKEIDLECDVIICDNHCPDRHGYYCEYDGDVEDLLPNDTRCHGLSLSRLSKDVSVSDVEKFEEYFKENDVPYACVDPDSIHIRAVQIAPRKYGVVLCDEKDIPEFRFWKSIDGSVGFTHQDQLELAFA